MRKKWTLGTVLVVVIALLAACGGNGSGGGDGGSADEVTIRLGYVGGGMTPIIAQIGMNDGSYEAAGVKIEKTSFTSGADMVQALVGGSLDMMLGSYEHVLRQQNNNLDVKAYAEIFNGVGYALVVKADAPYETLADLAGTTLAVTRVGSLSDTGLKEGLKEAGLNPERDVQIINGGSGATMFAAISSGQAAGGMVSEPTVSQMLASGEYRVLYDPPFPYAGIVVSANTSWVAENEDVMRRFLQVTYDVNERAQQDPASAVEAMLMEFDQIEPEIMEQAVRNQLAKVPAGLRVTEEAADIVLQTQLDEGILPAPIPYEQAVDLSLLP